ncbi:MAG: hypothetical protein ACYDEF_15565 [Methanosarcina sp.]
MIKSGTVKSVLLLAFIGIVLIALVEPIAGHTMGQGDMMGEHSANETMMYCMMGNQSANETMMYCMTVDHSANETMLQSITGNHSVNGSFFIVAMDQNVTNSAQARLDCARFWLEKAIKLHEVHLKDPSTATNESQMKMMDQMMRAYECIKGENVTENMTMRMTNLTGHASERH